VANQASNSRRLSLGSPHSSSHNMRSLHSSNHNVLTVTGVAAIEKLSLMCLFLLPYSSDLRTRCALENSTGFRPGYRNDLENGVWTFSLLLPFPRSAARTSLT
jgi:hypothetical protein